MATKNASSVDTITASLIERAKSELSIDESIVKMIESGELFIFESEGELFIESAEITHDKTRQASGAKPHLIALASAARESVEIGETWTFSISSPNAYCRPKDGKPVARRDWGVTVEGSETPAWKATGSITSAEGDTFKNDAVDFVAKTKKAVIGGKLENVITITFSGKRAN